MEWPENFGVPDGVPKDDTSSSTPDVDASSSTGPASDQDDGTQDAVQAEPQRSDGEPAPDTDTDAPSPDKPEPPPYRFQEVIDQRNRAIEAAQQLDERLRSIEAENQNFRRMLAAAAGVQGGDQDAIPDLSQKERELATRMRTLLERAFPGFGRIFDLAARADDLTSAADAAKDFVTDRSIRWNQWATDVTNRLSDGFVAATAGEGKTGKDVSQEALLQFQEDFYSWVATNPQRAERYESGDGMKLVEEFLQRQQSLYLSPSRRQEAAAVRDRVTRAAKLPVAGSSAAPGITQPKKPDSDDIDAVASHSWEVAKEAMAR